MWGVSTEADAVALLRAVRDGVADVPGAVVVAAAYADARRVAHAPLAPELLPRVARAAGVGCCLLDTAVKDGRGLLDWLAPDALASLVAEAHAAGLQVALAGALRAEDLPVVRATRRRHRRRPLGRLPRRPALRAARRRRASAPCSRRARLRRRACLDEPGDVEPVGDLARALAHGRGDGVAPDRGGLLGPRQQVVEELLRRAGSRSGSAGRSRRASARRARRARTPSRTPGSAPSARSSSSACCPASKTTPSSSMW